MKLYMVRHGQSVNNLEKKFTGWAQAVLTEEGIADARRAGKLLRGLSFDRIYASDLIRAVQTAKAAIPGCEPIQLFELRELDIGSLTMRSIEECRQEYGETFDQNRAQYNFVPYGGENLDMLRQRVGKFFKMLEEDPCDLAIAFAHAGTIRCAFEMAMGQSLPFHRFRCLNGSVNIFEYEKGEWVLETWGAQGME